MKTVPSCHPCSERSECSLNGGLFPEFPGARQFRDEVKRRLLSRDPFARPSLDQLEGHDFFGNEFNQIHHFLENLVLKGQEERKTFFM